MKSSLRPTVQALLIADHVDSDQATGRKIVFGILHHLNVSPDSHRIRPQGPSTSGPSTPADQHRSGSPFVYLNLNNVRGTQPLVLRYVNLANDNVYFECEFEVASDDPLSPNEVVIPLPSLPVNRAGTFALELLWNDEPLGVHRITVASSEDPVPIEGDLNG